MNPDSLTERIVTELDEIQHSRESRTDFLNLPINPILVFYPKDKSDVIKIVTVAKKYKVPVVVWGSGTSLAGHLSCEGCILLDMKYMNRILEINDVEWYVRVQPGVILGELNGELRKRGFFIPPEPASSFLCTVGGVISNASGGMRSVRYGTFKEWVLRLEVVLPNGELVTVGEPFVKNRAGYDLLHLFVGSEGTLGIITEAWLRITPLPPEKPFTVLIYLERFEEGVEVIKRLRRQGTILDVAEYMDETVVRAINKHFNTNLNSSSGGVLIISTPPVYERRVTDVLDSLNLRFERVEEEEILSIRALSGVALKAEWRDRVSEDVVVPLGYLDVAYREIKKLENEYGVRIALLAHLGDGNLHPNILVESRDDERLKVLYDRIGRLAVDLGGSVSGEHGIGFMKAELLAYQINSHNGLEVLRIMSDIKRLIDPQNQLNPNKFVQLAWNLWEGRSGHGRGWIKTEG